MELTLDHHLTIKATLDALFEEQITQDEAVKFITKKTPLTPDEVLALIAEMTDDVITEPQP
jgi:hypothetical protein